MDIKIKIAGEEQMPKEPNERVLVPALCDSNAKLMNELFQQYFGLDWRNRYMGNFPYADRKTGQPRVAWVISMESAEMRDSICSSLKEVIKKHCLSDIVVIKEDKSTSTLWPASIEIVAMGPSVTNTLTGELLIRMLLHLLSSDLVRVK
jgi:hypothetical protein